MAITGQLIADFSNFETEVKKAEVSLQRMEGGAAKAAVAIDRMSEGTTPSVNTLRESFGQVDQVLAASGVNIGKYAKGLFEIGEMSGKTASQIGALATGASLFSALMAGYQFGTWIAGWTGLADAVTKYAESLTDLPAEVAAAKQDTINLAIRNGASATISYTDAIKFNAEAMGTQLAKLENWGAVLATAQQRVKELTAAEIADIEVMQRAGATNDQIRTKYDLSALSLKLLGEAQRQAAKDADEHTRTLKEQQAALEKINTDYAKRIDLALHQIKVEDLAAEAAVRRRNEEQAALFEDLDIQARLNRQAEERAREAADAAAEERRIAANQAEIDAILASGPASTGGTGVSPGSQPLSFGGRPGFASVMNSPPSVVINAQGALLNNPDTLNMLARMVEDALARRGSLGTTYTRR
jgi:hypothetical protein